MNLMNGRGVARGLAAALGLAGTVSILGAAEQSGDSAWGLAFVGFLVMGTLVLWQQPTNRIAWLMWGIGMIVAVDLSVQWYAFSALGPGPVALELLVEPLGIAMFALLVVLVAVFPDGTPAGPWERRLVLGVAVVAMPIILVTFVSPRLLDSGRQSPFAIADAETWVRILVDDTFVVVPIALGLAAASLALRWRRSRGAVRAQFKWLTLGASVTLLALLSTFVVSDSSRLNSALVFGMAALPISIGVAISRTHLYDIDRIISRTASYTIVTAAVLAVYAVLVTTATRFVPDSNALAVAGATLAAAALARPLLRRVQGVVDRRFNRSRYDAERTVDSFGLRLSHEVDSETVSRDLVGVVSQTLQPHGVGLWVRSRS
jgi:hypothetical protein